MGLMNIDFKQFAQIFLGMLPTGKAWNKQRDSNTTSVVESLSPTWVDVENSANTLLVETFPASSNQLIPEWEASLGLPDDCSPASETVGARRANILAKIRLQGGANLQYFVDYAEDLGFDIISVNQLAPARAGCATAGSPIWSDAAAFYWQLNVLVNTGSVVFASANVTSAGEPLWDASSQAALECTLRQIIPANTILIFNYIEMDSTHWDNPSLFFDDPAEVWT